MLNKGAGSAFGLEIPGCLALHHTARRYLVPGVLSYVEHLQTLLTALLFLLLRLAACLRTSVSFDLQGWNFRHVEGLAKGSRCIHNLSCGSCNTDVKMT